MQSTCCLCHRNINTASQDYARLYSYPFVLEGRGLAHWLCFRLRIAQARNFQDELFKNINYIPNDTPLFGMPKTTVKQPVNIENDLTDALTHKCGYCKLDIEGDDDLACFHKCKHKTVHFNCLNFVDFTRKEGCPYCYNEDAKRYRQSWLVNDTDSQKKQQQPCNEQQTPMMNHSYIPKQDDKFGSSGGSTMTTTTFTSTVVKQGENDDHVIITSSIVKPLFQQTTDARIIQSEYARTQKYMAEPSYPTAIRKLLFELNMNNSGKHIICDTNLLLKTYSQIYSVDDLILMGLTLPIVVYNRNEMLLFSVNYLYSMRLSKEFLGADFFINMLLAGITVKFFVVQGLRRDCNDLNLIDFNINAYWAAGGIMLRLESFMTEVCAITFSGSRTDFKSLLPNFGATKESLDYFFE